MLSAFSNSMKIPELRSRILYTLALLFVARVCAHIPLPGLDPKPLQDFFNAQSAGAGGGLLPRRTPWHERVDARGERTAAKVASDAIEDPLRRGLVAGGLRMAWNDARQLRLALGEHEG